MKNNTAISSGRARRPCRAVRLLHSATVAILLAFGLQSAAYSLEIQNGPATNITATNAWLVGNLISTNTTNATLTCYYGKGNGGTNPVLWQYSNTYGVAASTGLVSVSVSNLTPATWYYFNWSAAENTNTAWPITSSNFTALARPPANYPVPSAGRTMTADINGNVLFPTNPIFPGINLGGVTRTTWPEHGTGDVATWSFYPATQTVDMADQAITFGGVTRTNWPVDATDVAVSNAALGTRVGTLEAEVSNLQSDVSNNYAAVAWSSYPATQTVDMAAHGINLGGVTRTTWPDTDPSSWAQYPASEDVDIGNRSIFNAAWIELGGVYRSSWPVEGSNWASTAATTNINLAGFVISNGSFLGTVPALTNYSTNTHSHAQYKTNSADWSGYPATQTVNMANKGLANVSAISLGGITRSNWTVNSQEALNVSKLSVGPTSMVSPQLVNLFGTNQAWINQAVYGTATLQSQTNYATAQTVINERGTLDWTTPENIADADYTNSGYFTRPSFSYDTSKVVRASSFGFAIPENAIILGIKASVVSMEQNTRANNIRVQLWNNGSTSSVYATGDITGTPFAIVTNEFGATNSLWNLSSLSAMDINDNNFALDLWVTGEFSEVFHIYTIELKVFYTIESLAWRTGVDSDGHYKIIHDNTSKKSVDISTNGDISVGDLEITNSMTLGGVTRTDWPSGTVGNHTNLTGVNDDPDVQHLTTAEKAIATNPASSGTFNHTALTNLNGDADYQHLTTPQLALVNNSLQPGSDGTSTNLGDYNNNAGFVKADITNGLNDVVATKAGTNDLTAHTTNTLNPHTVTAAQVGAVATNDPSYLTIISSMTNYVAVAASSNYLAWNPVTRTLTGCVTNQGGISTGGAGNITNMLSDGSVEWRDSGGPQPIASVTNHLISQGYISNNVIVAGGSNMQIRAEGGTNFFDSTLVCGIYADQYFCGSWGYIVSNQVLALNGATGNLNTIQTAVVGATGSLNTAVTALNGATNNLQVQTTANSGATNNLQIQVTALAGATGNINTIQTAVVAATNSLQAQVTALNGVTNPLGININANTFAITNVGVLSAASLQITGLSGNGVVPIGAVQMYAASNAPAGWLLCDGAAVSRVTYTNLWMTIFTTYGAGDASTTFNVPNLVQRFPLGATNYLGVTSGVSSVTLTVDQIPAHHHTETTLGSSGAVNGGSTYANTAANTSDTGGGQPHTNMPPNITINYIIKY